MHPTDANTIASGLAALEARVRRLRRSRVGLGLASATLVALVAGGLWRAGRSAPPVHGLRAEYFDDQALTDRKLTRLEALRTETTRLCLFADDGVRLWLGDRVLIDAWRPQAPSQIPPAQLHASR